MRVFVFVRLKLFMKEHVEEGSSSPSVLLHVSLRVFKLELLSERVSEERASSHATTLWYKAAASIFRDGVSSFVKVPQAGANRPKMVTHINFLKILSIGRKSHAIRVPRKKISNPRPFEVSRVGFGGWKLSFPCQGRLFITKVGPINLKKKFY